MPEHTEEERAKRKEEGRELGKNIIVAGVPVVGLEQAEEGDMVRITVVGTVERIADEGLEISPTKVSLQGMREEAAEPEEGPMLGGRLTKRKTLRPEREEEISPEDIGDKILAASRKRKSRLLGV